jgi:hypothetical protein
VKIISLGLASVYAVAVMGCGTLGTLPGRPSDEPPAQNISHAFHARPEQTFRAVVSTLVQKGFNVEQVDPGSGLIKAMRPYSDPEHPEINYHIAARAEVKPGGSTQDSLVTLAASQRTVTHAKSRGQPATLAGAESGIVSATFYQDFFDAVERTLSSGGDAGSNALTASPKPSTVSRR